MISGRSMKTTKGRQKIEIKKIEETNSRQVTFSKRRTGLFKKASELCVLTGAQVAILVNSPGGRLFAFGHPNSDDLVDRYIGRYNKNKKVSPPPLPTKELNEHYVEVSRKLEVEKRRSEMIPASSSGGLPWYHEPVEGVDVEELELYLCSLMELKKKIVTRADELMMIKKSPELMGGGRNVFGLGWSNSIPTVGGFPTNATVHGGFMFQRDEEFGRF